MSIITILRSQQDQSVNFVRSDMMEARYVRRERDYFIAYLSSHTGCNKACRFCHLTQTGQTDFVPATFEDYVHQAQQVLAYYDADGIQLGGRASRVNFNFMARGEPLANPMLLARASALFDSLSELADRRGLAATFNISSILPDSLESPEALDKLACAAHDQVLYYSLYSVDPAFRKRWLPKSLPVDQALAMLRRWQDITGQLVVIHGAFIEGQNDSPAQVDAMLDAIEQHGLRAKFNLVRYNPYSAAQGRESPDAVIQANFDRIQARLAHPCSRIVPRVGFDVAASCGMFVTPQGLAA
ncbi:Ribosomal RNA large subunit methyltransferase Cfr [Achromobacter anxifer]|uniref:radical SAM protein n=1 Tax=Achromobacter anxifer TaxID=1287737 RepID=UPI00155CBF6E|nr:radical SAM protein [Achromobacter anxifer]CAB5514336.1 Ribosomal RNA large subunit methyltransferase Cfr [Achromobacter anxifer]